MRTVDKETAVEGGTCGVVDLKLTAGAEDGVSGATTRPAGFQVWNSSLMNADFDADYGDPNGPLRAIRIVTTRNGSGSGKVVVASPAAIEGLTAKMSDLTEKGGNARIPATAVQVRYAKATQYGGAGDYGLGNGSTDRFDMLEEVAPLEVPVSIPRVGSWPERVALKGAVAPVWVTVKVPADAKAGEYAGNLTITATGQTPVEAPLEVRVCSWRLPEPDKWLTFVDIMESPESVAMAYNVPLWSEVHFKLLAKSLTLLGEVGNKTCHVPLICETNMGNDESMVRWIKQPDGSYKHDYGVMKKYLDAVEKYQGKPTVVCFYVWDTYLEGGLTGIGREGSLVVPNVVADRKQTIGKGPIVSVLDPATGKVEKGILPLYSEPASEALWAPVMKEIRERTTKRGLQSAMMIGYVTDEVASKEVGALFAKISPGTKWVRTVHDQFRDNIMGLSLGYTSEPYVWARRLFCEDPSVSRSHGWRLNVLEAHFPRNIYDDFPMTQWRYMAEMNAAGELRGFARLGGDFFPVRNAKGQISGSYSARFPKLWWRMLNIQTTLLEPGKKVTVATARFEVLREGLQECAARIFIDKARWTRRRRRSWGRSWRRSARNCWMDARATCGGR